jgi:hypothetical protein
VFHDVDARHVNSVMATDIMDRKDLVVGKGLPGIPDSLEPACDM